MTHYEKGDLERFPEIAEDAPELAAKFFDWYGATFEDGALTAREKSLIALALSAVHLRIVTSLAVFTIQVRQLSLRCPLFD